MQRAAIQVMRILVTSVHTKETEGWLCTCAGYLFRLTFSSFLFRFFSCFLQSLLNVGPVRSSQCLPANTIIITTLLATITILSKSLLESLLPLQWNPSLKRRTFAVLFQIQHMAKTHRCGVLSLVRPFDSIQGDVILGFPKRVESFVFFTIIDATEFRTILKSDLARKISSTADVNNAKAGIATARCQASKVWLPIKNTNLGFSATGLTKLGIDVATEFPTDKAFASGQEADAITNLGDPQASGQLNSWKSEFKGKQIDGVLVVAASKQCQLDEEVQALILLLGKSVKVIYQIDGIVRPGVRSFSFFVKQTCLLSVVN